MNADPLTPIRHNEAIARVIRGAAPLDQVSINIANAIRTTTDPAALAAMLETLARAGVLTREEFGDSEGSWRYVSEGWAGR